MWINGACSQVARSLRIHAKLVRSTNVPRQIWVMRVVFSKGLEFLFSLPVLAVFALLYAAEVNWRLVYLVPASLLLCALLLGVGFILAPLVVLVRDLERVVRIGLRVMFYASPVIYAVRDVPEPWDILWAVNPLAAILELFRAGFFPHLVDYGQVAVSAVTCLTILVVGWFVFARLERTILKEL
jgi:ABC-2 type transport system permease protein